MSSSTIPANSSATQTPFKDQLDEAAQKARHPASNQKDDNPSLLEKVAEYVPAPAAKLLGMDKKNNTPEQEPPKKDLSGTPNRPEHDDQIAEFVREQHRSKNPDGSQGL